MLAYNKSINLNYMAKNKLVKNITIDELAQMVQEGFAKTASKEQIDKIEKDIVEIKHDLKETVKRTDKLEMRVDYVENILDLPAKKH